MSTRLSEALKTARLRQKITQEMLAERVDPANPQEILKLLIHFEESGHCDDQKL